MTSCGFNETFYATVSFIKQMGTWEGYQSSHLALVKKANIPNCPTILLKKDKTMTTKQSVFLNCSDEVWWLWYHYWNRICLPGPACFFFFNSNTQVLIQHSQFLHLPIQLFLNLVHTSPQASHYFLTCFHLPQWYLNPLSGNDIMSTPPIIQPALKSMALFCIIVTVSVRWHELNAVVERG